MQFPLKTICMAAAMIISGTLAASAQGSTDRNGNAVGSQNIPDKGAATSTMHDKKTTTGSSRMGPTQNSPNGSPTAPPTAKEGPDNGDPSSANDVPK